MQALGFVCISLVILRSPEFERSKSSYFAFWLGRCRMVSTRLYNHSAPTRLAGYILLLSLLAAPWLKDASKPVLRTARGLGQSLAKRGCPHCMRARLVTTDGSLPSLPRLHAEKDRSPPRPPVGHRAIQRHTIAMVVTYRYTDPRPKYGLPACISTW